MPQRLLIGRRTKQSRKRTGRVARQVHIGPHNVTVSRRRLDLERNDINVDHKQSFVQVAIQKPAIISFPTVPRSRFGKMFKIRRKNPIGRRHLRRECRGGRTYGNVGLFSLGMTLPLDCASPSMQPKFHTKCSSIELAITSTSPIMDRIRYPAALAPLQAILRGSSKVPSRVESIGPGRPCPSANPEMTLTTVGAVRTLTGSRDLLASNRRALARAMPAPWEILGARHYT